MQKDKTNNLKLKINNPLLHKENKAGDCMFKLFYDYLQILIIFCYIKIILNKSISKL